MCKRWWAMLPVAVLAGAAVAGTLDESRISMSSAERMDLVLNDLLAARREGRTLPQVVAFTEKELNSYLYYKAAPQLPPNLKNIDIRLKPEQVTAEADLDLSPSGGQESRVPGVFQRPIGLYMSGRLTTKNGMGYFQPDSVRIGFFPIPVSVLDAIVQSVTERQTGKPHSLNDWFPLPYQIKEIRVLDQSLLIVP